METEIQDKSQLTRVDQDKEGWKRFSCLMPDSEDEGDFFVVKLRTDGCSISIWSVTEEKGFGVSFRGVKQDAAKAGLLEKINDYFSKQIEKLWNQN